MLISGKHSELDKDQRAKIVKGCFKLDKFSSSASGEDLKKAFEEVVKSPVGSGQGSSFEELVNNND
jgi:hypothetical protein